MRKLRPEERKIKLSLRISREQHEWLVKNKEKSINKTIEKAIEAYIVSTRIGK